MKARVHSYRGEAAKAAVAIAIAVGTPEQLKPEPRAFTVLGIDPGTANLGLAVVDFSGSKTRVTHRQVVKAGGLEVDDQMRMLARSLLNAEANWHPDLIVYEDQAGVEAGMQRAGTGSNFSSRRVHEVVGMIRMLCVDHARALMAIHPATLKVAVLGKGGGRAKKERVQEAVRVLLGVRDCSSHEADALALCIAGRRRYLLEMSSNNE